MDLMEKIVYNNILLERKLKIKEKNDDLIFIKFGSKLLVLSH